MSEEHDTLAAQRPGKRRAGLILAVAVVAILLVLVLLVFQITVGHKPSKLVYAYWVVAFLIIGLSVMIVRPVLQ